MNWFDFSFNRPEENLALDEALLNAAEDDRKGEILRFWESPAPFVVLGVAQQIKEEVQLEQCEADGIPVLRRCTAGGCVLQGPGSLNFSLVLDTEERPELRNLHDSYKIILGQVADGFHMFKQHLVHAGISDLTFDGFKVSGNAQRRRKRYILHHGTLLYALNLRQVSQYLREPTDRPEYRGSRNHDSFVRNLPLSRGQIWGALMNAFSIANDEIEPPKDILETARTLAVEKYGTLAWTHRR